VRSPNLILVKPLFSNTRDTSDLPAPVIPTIETTFTDFIIREQGANNNGLIANELSHNLWYNMNNSP
jgi:hypothetical protein